MFERPDAVNWSTLKYLRISPRHYRHALVSPREDTIALLLGRVTHAMVYEPLHVAARYARAPKLNRAMNDDTAIAKGYDGGKQMAAQFDAECQARKLEVVPVDLWTRAEAMADALRSDPVASPLVVGGFAEQLVTWTDAKTGIECRGRIDHIDGRLSDLKTARCVEPRIFASQAVRLGYHAQLAFYADGLAANGIVLDEPPALIAVESEPPHDVAVFEFTAADLAAGRAVYRACLTRLAECRATDKWPGVAGGERVRIALPEWAMPQMELTMGGVPLDFE